MPLSSSELVVLSESTILMIVFVDYDLSLFYKVYKMLLKTLVCVCVCVRAGGRACVRVGVDLISVASGVCI